MLKHKLMMLFALAAILTLPVFSTNANAQCSDANVNRAIQEVTGRAPYRDADWNECTMFGNVSRLSYAALVNKVKGAGFCRDPWITKAYFKQTRSRIPAGWGTTNECNTKVYNQGSWGSFVLLRGYVNDYLNGVAQSGNKFVTVYKYNVNPTTNSNALVVIGTLDSATAPKARLMTKVETVTGEPLIGNDGASMVAAGGGNYAPPGTPMVAAGGGNIVTTGGVNLISNAAFYAPPSTIPMFLVNSTNSRNLPGRLRIKF